MVNENTENIEKVVQKQNAIIRMQSNVIDELFLLLMQHISVDEAENLKCIETINEAAKLKNSIDHLQQ